MNLAAEELCPVAESLLGQLYRSSPEGVAVLIETVPPLTGPPSRFTAIAVPTSKVSDWLSH